MNRAFGNTVIAKYKALLAVWGIALDDLQDYSCYCTDMHTALAISLVAAIKTLRYLLIEGLQLLGEIAEESVDVTTKLGLAFGGEE
jgi:hypothetical protein